MPLQAVSKLVMQLSVDSSPDWESRQKAAQELEALGSEARDALQALEEVVSSDGDPDVRVSALQAIAAIDEDKPRLVQKLAGFLGDEHYWQVRQAAAEALEALGSDAKDAFYPLLKAAYTDTDEDVRQSALQATKAIVAFDQDPSTYVDKLIQLLGDDSVDWEVRQKATQALGGDELRPHAEAALKPLWAVLKEDDSQEMRNSAWQAIVNIGGAEQVKRLVIDPKVVHEGDLGDFFLSTPGDRFNLAWDSDPKATLDFILARLRDETNYSVRVEAVARLEDLEGKIPPDQVSKVLNALQERKQNDGDVYVRDKAREAASKFQVAASRLLQTIRDSTQDTDEQVLLGAIAEVAKHPSPELFRVLVQKWVEWIAYGNNPLLVEEAANTIRYSPDAVAPLVGQFRKGLQVDNGLKCWILLDDVHQSLPTAHRSLRSQLSQGVSTPPTERGEEGRPAPGDAQSPAQVMQGLAQRLGLGAQPTGHNHDHVFDYNDLVEAVLGLYRNERGREELFDWLDSLRYMPTEFADLKQELLRHMQLENDAVSRARQVLGRRPGEKLVKNMVESFVENRVEYRKLRVRRRIAEQLAYMSDGSRIEDDRKQEYLAVKAELQKHAVPVLAGRLAKEDDFEVRRDIARTLGFVSGRDAVEALAEAIIGEERTKMRRQQLLDEYYLKPSRQRSEEAAAILKSAESEAKRTLGTQRSLNTIVLLVGLVIIAAGLLMAMLGNDRSVQVTGALTSIGGFAGLMAQFIRSPLDRIQNAMSNLVQMEAAFISFIWELNLNSTYIQSQYVAKGELSDHDIARTVKRIENAMALAMNLVQTYTVQGTQRIVTRINVLSPSSGDAASRIAVQGQYLQGDSLTQKERSGMIFINHKPIDVEDVSWNEHEVQFTLPARDRLPGVENGEDTVWVSLLIDGMETNALPFRMLEASNGTSQPASPAAAPASVEGPRPA